MRGALRVAFSMRSRVRIIPAYAGSTRLDAADLCCAGDHPRVCGEHVPKDARCRTPVGSSPRMRGARHQHPYQQLGLGIIPAYAGSTRDNQMSSKCARDHPRVCGEHMACWAYITFRSGSSPRMRGAHQPGVVGLLVQGIIPAYAGSTTWRFCGGVAKRDHPHVCGEHLPTLSPMVIFRGSSPRMRGARWCLDRGDR